VVFPWLVVTIGLVVVARTRSVPLPVIAVSVIGLAWAFAIVAASLFPFPLPPYPRDTVAGPAFDNLPNLWLNPFPFHTIAKATRGAGTGTTLALANVIAYLPLGMVVGLLDPRARLLRMIAIALLVSGGIELMQLTISLAVGFPYRAADIDDVLLNVIGALGGFALVRLLPTERFGLGIADPQT
jgi:glycopeptide antibiotics resistance protein